MRNPAGGECRYFYGDYYRGRDREECRLLEEAWSKDLCGRCPVPQILRTNACPNMTLSGAVERRLLGRKRVRIRAYCRRHEQAVSEPAVGCGHCHESR